MHSVSIEDIIKTFNWYIITRMYGNSHSSIIGFLSSQWISMSTDHSVLDGAPSSIVGKGRKGQKNADILLCKGDKPYIVVEVESVVSKYMEKIDSVAEYMENKKDYDGLAFGLVVMLNYTEGSGKYKHNWLHAKEYAASKNIPIAFVSIEKRRTSLGDTVLDRLKRRNEYYPWRISNIDYWIYGSDRTVIENNLLRRDEDMLNNSQTKDRRSSKELLISNKELESVIKNMGLDEFTVLDIADYIEKNEKELWDRLKLAYMNKDKEKKYTYLNYLSTRLWIFSRSEDSCLQTHVSYNEDKNKCFRKATDEEKKIFKNNNVIAVFRVKDKI